MLSVPFIAIAFDLLLFADSWSRVRALDLLSSTLAEVLFELAEIGLPAFVVGSLSTSAYVLLTGTLPSRLRLGQAIGAEWLSTLVAIAAVIHNPQGEYCIGGEGITRIAGVYLADPCTLTSSLLILQLAWWLTLFVIVLMAERLWRLMNDFLKDKR